MTPSQTARRRGKTPPDEYPLTSERDNREGLTFMRLEEDIQISPADRFAIVPGPKGHGWTLLVHRGSAEDEN